MGSPPPHNQPDARAGAARSGAALPGGQLLGERLRVESLRPYWAALADRAAAPVTHMWIGDSLTEGEGAGALRRRWVDLTLAALRERFQPAGIAGGVGYLASFYLVTEFGGSPWVPAGAPLIACAGGIGQKALALHCSGQAIGLTFLGTGCDLLYGCGPDGGEMIVALDGGVGVSVQTRAPSSSQCNVRRVRGLAAGPHAIEVAWRSGRIVFEGAMIYDGDETLGLRGIEFGHAGWMAADFLDPRSLQAVRATIANYRPALITLQLGTNECAEGVAPDAFRRDLQALVDEILSCVAAPTSVLLFNPYNGAGRSIDHWQPYNRAVAEVVRESSGRYTPSVGMFDLAERFGDMARDALGLTLDRTHLNNAGNQMWADALVPFLSP